MIALTDLDSVLHIVANVQYKAGNRDNDKTVKAHVKRFIRTVEKNSGADRMLRFFQDKGHDNYRNEILPEYKSHRKKSDAIECWKPTIVEAFQEMHAIALTAIESDDAINVVARDLKEEYTILSGDKDMLQIPGKHYNPFSPHLGKVQDPRRWKDIGPVEAERFLWQQIMTGDSVDMPNALCGIEGIGQVTAKKLIEKARKPSLAVSKAYVDKYGKTEGFNRANLTYKMVKLALLTDDEISSIYE